MRDLIHDPRKQQDIICQIVWEDILRAAMNVQSLSFDTPLELDKQRAIDVYCMFANGMMLSGQIKSLSYKYNRYASVTVEYMNNQADGIKGDWFAMGAHLYACGYCMKELDDIIKRVIAMRLKCVEDIQSRARELGVGSNDTARLSPWIILSWTSVVLETVSGNMTWRHNVNRSRGLADFMYVPMRDIPGRCIIAKSKQA
jgi:hypothetical protein